METHGLLTFSCGGGSIGNSDTAWFLNNPRLSQTFVQAGNLGIPDFVLQVGTLENYFETWVFMTFDLPPCSLKQ